MKIRAGFVSNSSSSSFVIRLDNITRNQMDDILNYSKTEECRREDSYWNIEVSEKAGIMYGHNGDTYGYKLYNYMTKIGVDTDKLYHADY